MEKDQDLQPLSDEVIKEKLKNLPGWNYHDNKITKEFKFKSFLDAIEFIDKLAIFCNNMDHHPDIHIYYKRIVFDLTRFSAGEKVTERDFTVASEIERLWNIYSHPSYT